MAGLAMFVFKRGLRNNADMGVCGSFEKNYRTLFGMRLPVMDTVDSFLRDLESKELEELKQCLVSGLIRKRVLDSSRYRGRFTIAFDGTGLYSYDYELMQIAHLINRLTEKLQKVRDAIKSARTTIKAVVEEMISSMQKEQISIDDMKAAMQLTVQLRY